MLVFCWFFFTACEPHYKYPVEPYLEFVSLEHIASVQNIEELRLLLKFTDGDGDIGETPRPSDTAENLKIMLFLKENEQWHCVDTFGSFGAWVTPLLSSGEESISGTIEVPLNVRYIRELYFPTDTIRFECWLIDRQNHHSNHVFTDEYVIVKY